ncbi:hypothetical protein FGO68_gene6465 [Halteria grandinella]|uniref:Uncharacterized protein n=1 Tax=Halteria grandinella TaxID=5974 RepID=A0A8J8NWH7_HALGN|nr:hypothetical protein FGO68_gene6465 [Halteria grandinella]
MDQIKRSYQVVPNLFNGQPFLEMLRQRVYSELYGIPYAQNQQNKIIMPNRNELAIEGAESVIFLPYQIESQVPGKRNEIVLVRSKYQPMRSERIEDFLGKQEFRKIRFSEDMCSTCALILLYDISSRESFEGMKNVLKAFQDYNSKYKLYPRKSSTRDIFLQKNLDENVLQGEDKNYQIFEDLYYLVGVEKFPQTIPLYQRQIPFEEASNLARQYNNVKYFEISTVTQHNIDKMFSLITEDLRRNDRVNKLYLFRERFLYWIMHSKISRCASFKLLCKHYWQNFTWLKLYCFTLLMVLNIFSIPSTLVSIYYGNAQLGATRAYCFVFFILICMIFLMAGEILPIVTISHRFYKGAYNIWTIGFIIWIGLKYLYYKGQTGIEDGVKEREFIQKDVINELQVLLPLSVGITLFFALFLHICSIRLTP